MVSIRISYKNTFIGIQERKYVQESRDTEKENRRHQALSGAAARTGEFNKKRKDGKYIKREEGGIRNE